MPGTLRPQCLAKLVTGFGLAGLGFACAASAKANSDDIADANREASRALAAYKATGLPWTAKEVRKDLPISARDDATPLLRAAIKRFDSQKFSKESNSLRKLISVKNWAQFRKAFGSYNTALNQAVQASKLPKVNFGHDYDLGSTLMFKDEVSFKYLVKGLCFRAIAESSERNQTGCVRDIRAAWRITNLLGQEPLMIDLLVEVACRAIVVRSVETCARDFRHDPKTLILLRSVLQDNPHLTFDPVLRGEAYCGIAQIRNFKASGGLKALEDPGDEPVKPLDPKRVVRVGMPTDREERAYMVRCLQGWTALSKLYFKPAKDFSTRQHETDALGHQFTENKSPSYRVEAIMFPVFTQGRTVVERANAETTATAALLTALATFQDDRRLPTSIGQIPGTWTDPFTGKPMHVLNQPGKFRIYSVGESLHDHHGLFQSDRKLFALTEFDVGASYQPH